MTRFLTRAVLLRANTIPNLLSSIVLSFQRCRFHLLNVSRLPDVGQVPGLRRVHPGLQQGEQVLHLEAGADLAVDQLHDVVLGQGEEAAAINTLRDED